ncbi:MAG TPA: hypothetical protein VG672_04375 [Bryobacteraceae bacterium]|nr:hypothetical protein [Bryobacteraceae bacterium]
MNARCKRAHPGVLRSIEHDQFIYRKLYPLRGNGGELARTVWSPMSSETGLSPDGTEVAIPNHDPRNARLRLVPLGARARVMEEWTITLNGLKDMIGVVWAPGGQGWFVSVGSSFSATRPDGRLPVYADLRGRISMLLESVSGRAPRGVSRADRIKQRLADSGAAFLMTP